MRLIQTAAILVLGFAALPASAATIGLNVSGGGLNGVNTRTCTSATCATTVWSLATGEVYGATGTITIDTTLNTMTIALGVASSTLDADPALSQSATDLGASSLVFTGGTYTTIALPVTAAPGGAGTTVYTLASGQVGGVSFTNVVPTGASLGGPLSLSAVRVTGACSLAADNTGTCGISFGASGTTNFRVTSGTYDRWVQHTFNVSVVPEPGTMLLLGLGLSGLALRSRRAVFR